ncbi:15-hydroxyprostaglandin dehydrogenase [nad(+)] [Holotrichia oblita]|uniref:15-hydroxyprostaglandin dehydrogenase [nad(+)] n=1 Tax=Holotrichia oblita TaxID=644536 RepID=A0ACB9SYZ8_HOLOL|nr:15-hydroxyprostaglandin dehydrogenase [nad(+)] [Holotrichia oblita]
MTAVRGKFACVTGGFTGIGYEFSKTLLRNGVKGLFIADMNEKGAPEAINKLQQYGDAEIKFEKIDLMNMYQAECMLKKMVNEFEHIDILVNRASIVAEANYESMINVNYIGLLYTTMLALYRYMPKYKSGDEGIIVNISSIFGIQPGFSAPVYGATKHAVIGIGRSFGTDYYYNRYKVKILTMCPGSINNSLSEDPNIDLDIDLFKEEIKNYPSQEVAYCGKCLEKMLEKPENNAVWITEGREIYQYPIENTFVRQK